MKKIKLLLSLFIMMSMCGCSTKEDANKFNLTKITINEKEFDGAFSGYLEFYNDEMTNGKIYIEYGVGDVMHYEITKGEFIDFNDISKTVVYSANSINDGETLNHVFYGVYTKTGNGKVGSESFSLFIANKIGDSVNFNFLKDSSD